MPSQRNERRWKNSHLVRERDAQRARSLWLTLALVVAAVAPAGLYLYEQNSCLQLSYEIDSIEEQRGKLDENERRLQVEQAGIASMQSIERWAARKRLERPDAEEVFVVPHRELSHDPVMASVPEGDTSRTVRRVE